MTSLDIAIENTGFLRSTVMTASRNGQDPFTYRYHDYGLLDVRILDPIGFTVGSANPVNIGWLGGGRPDDPAPSVKAAGFDVSELSAGDSFTVSASSEKTGQVTAFIEVVAGGENGYEFRTVSTNYVTRPKVAEAYFMGKGPDFVKQSRSLSRSLSQIQQDIDRAEQNRRNWKRIEGPFDVIPGLVS